LSRVRLREEPGSVGKAKRGGSYRRGKQIFNLAPILESALRALKMLGGVRKAWVVIRKSGRQGRKDLWRKKTNRFVPKREALKKTSRACGGTSHGADGVGGKKRTMKSWKVPQKLEKVELRYEIGW